MSITAIIPAYNEEERVATVIGALKESEIVNEILVVSDGSVDNTAQVSRDAGARVIELEVNIGKGGAMLAGLQACQSDIVLFLDADLIGLKSHHIHDLLMPVIENKAQTTIGLFESGRFATDLAHKVAPFLSGQRAMRRELIQGLPELEVAKFGVEVALTHYIKKNNISVQKVILKDVTHVMKEEKMGLMKGFASRLKMYWEIASRL